MNRSQIPMRLCLLAVFLVSTAQNLLLSNEYISKAPPLFCNDEIVVSSGSDCEIDISAASVLEGELNSGPYTLELQTLGGIVLDMSDLSDHIGDKLKYVVTDATGVSCWGNIIVEDKMDPTIICNSCTDPDVSDPACNFSCTEWDLFSSHDFESNKTGYASALLESILPTDIDQFIATNVSDNCDQDLEVSYEDAFVRGNCARSYKMIRTWKVTWDKAHGETGTIECKRYYTFNPIPVTDLSGEPIIIEGDCTPIEDRVIMPQGRVIIEGCGIDPSPASIAAYFDDPETKDYDSDGDGIDPEDDDIDCVVEYNEGICYAYPHIFLPGVDKEGMYSGLHPQPLEESVCNIKAIYNDIELEVCEPGCTGNLKLARTWTIYDWCSGVSFEYEQIIKLVDSTPPVMDVTDVKASVDPWVCEAIVRVPAPEHLYDECDLGQIDYQVQVIGRIVQIEGSSTEGYTISGLKIGTHQLLYIATDCCGNENRTIVNLVVEDQTSPVPVTKENIVVEMIGTGVLSDPTDGIAKIFAKDLDNGSYDSCTEVDVYIRRPFQCSAADTVWGESVRFCCDDLDGQITTEIKVEFMVVDKNGNENFAWSIIQLEDKHTINRCPPDIVLPCEIDITDFSKTGGIPTTLTSCYQIPIEIDTLEVLEDTEPTFKSANRGNVPGYIGVEVPAYNPSCGFGALRRDFDQCRQWIVLEPSEHSIFDPSTIVFPQDTLLTCLDGDSGVPTWVNGSCSLIAHTVESDTFRFAPDACVKIINHWAIIDWCLYNPKDPDLNYIEEAFDADGDGEPNISDTDDDNDGIPDDTYYTDDKGTTDPSDDEVLYEPDLFDPVVEDSGETEGYYRHTQSVKFYDTVKPTIECVDEICFPVNSNCEASKISLTAIGDDLGDCPSPWLGWTVYIDYDNDWNIDYEYSTFTHKIIDGEPNPFYIERTVRDAQVRIALPDTIPGSNKLHRADWVLSDGCQNNAYHTTYFTVEDKTAPTPYCLNLSTAVMDNGEVELWAKDFDRGSFDNCSQDVIFTFTDIPPPPRCDEEYSRYIGDDPDDWYDGTYWFYESSEIVQVDPEDDDEDCPNNGFGEYEDLDDYEGTIHRWEPGLGTSGAIFTAENVDANGYMQLPVYMWDENQNIGFCLVNLRVIEGTTGSNRIEGQFMTEDEQMIDEVQSQLMTTLPNYPIYKMTGEDGLFAFDDLQSSVNYQITGSKNTAPLNGVSTIDLVRIQRHILGVEKLDSPYKMIAADINKDRTINGLDLIELRKLILGVYTEFPQNRSWRFVNSDQELNINNPWDYTETREIENLASNYIDQNFIGVKIGDVDNSVELKARPDFSSRNAMYLEFEDQELSKGELVEVNFSSSSDWLAVQASLHFVKLKFVDFESDQVEESSTFLQGNSFALSHFNMAKQALDFKITFEVLEDGKLLDMLSLKDEEIEATAFENLRATSPLKLRALDAQEFKLFQNEPNPFRNNTTVKFVLPTAQEVSLSFYDATGRVLKQIVKLGKEGINSVSLNKGDLMNGLIYYTLEAGDYKATKHMIVID